MSAEIIKNYLKNAPQTPGIYQMLDGKGGVVYVGKAKNLRKRLNNYATARDHTYRILQMIAQVETIEIIKTNNELEALLLEANLIKKCKPKYNILLKDDKSFPYLLVREDHNFPQITKYRGLKKIKGKYFGPFTSPSKVDETLSYLQKAFLLRSCSDNYFASRKRPCLLYQVKRCSAPCVNKISQDDYLLLVNQAKDFLSGKNSDLQKQLAVQMQQASDRMDYEQASSYRDRIKILSYIQAKQVIELKNTSDFDVIAIAKSATTVSIQIFFFRAGQNLGNKAYFPEHTEYVEFDEILSNFIIHFYQHNHIPPLILLSEKAQEQDLLAQALWQIAEHKISIEVPKLGQKLELVKFALNNIQSELTKKLEQYDHYQQMLAEIKSLFGITSNIKRIEIYDNSHISGKFAVGAMVVATADGFDKSQYRQYNITLATEGDDYAMLREVLTRRFKRNLPLPELVLIDGGAGHLKVAAEIILGLNQNIYIAAIAKGRDRNAGRETFHTLDKGEFTLDRDTKLMKHLQLLRDEAHRFAITSHRAKRSRAIRASSLDQIEGIGTQRKKLLLEVFGSIANIENATIEQLQQIKTINKNIAEKIYRYFHK